MKPEVQIYLATARPAPGGAHPADGRYALHVYLLSHEGADFNGPLAEAVAARSGWILTEIRDAARMNDESARGGSDTVRGCYEATLKQGSALLVYEEPVKTST